MFKRFILCCFLILLGCGKNPSSPAQKPLLLVSIAPYESLVRRIAGQSFEVQSVVPQAANPHSFEPTSGQVTEMKRGRVWFRIGEPFEPKVISVLQKHHAELAICDLREGISLIEEGPHFGCKQCGMDHLDRHVWMSPKLAAVQAERIALALGEQFPELKAEFVANAKGLASDLAALDAEIQEILKPVEKRLILVSHPAFGYFCKEYDLTQLSVEYEGKDPRPKHLEEILQRATTESAELALALPQYNNRGAQLIAEKLRVPVHWIDPYSEDYFETMRRLAHLIADPYAN